jgi:ATPase subunit of ABC transporter with duplicated ATPase domains
MPPHGGTLAATDIVKSYGADVVLDGVTLVVPPRARIGVVGPNGSGKSTLLRVLAGLQRPDSGRVTRRPPDLSVRYVAQERRRPGLSGGEAAREALYEILDAGDDVLCLDEPTNDLDFPGLALLERFVRRTPSAIVVVSHDRAFLETVAQRVLEFEGETRRVREFSGGWGEYERAREEGRRRHERDYAEYREERDRFEALLRQRRGEAGRGGKLGKASGGADRRGTHALSQKVRQAERRLERLAPVDKPWAPWHLELAFEEGSRGGDVVARLEGAVIERDGFRLGPIDLDLRRGDRLAIVGPNGSGKTTLIRALLGELPLARGSRTVGRGTRFGVLEQDRAFFDCCAPLLARFRERTGLTETEARSLLAKFALGADDVMRAARSLSPGERTRGSLALLAAERANALVLDEPTNHLDLEAIEELETALVGFSATVVLITHDRRFLEAFAATRTLELGSASASG